MSCAGSCLQTKLSTASPAWPPTPAPMPCQEPSTTCRSLPLCTERATSEHSVSRPDLGPPAYLLQSPPRPPTAPSPHSCPTTLIFCMSLALSFCHYPLSAPPHPPRPPPAPLRPLPHTCPASSPLLHTLSPLYLLSTQCSNSPGLQRGREKNVCFCFYFLVVIVFLHKMNKVNIFYYTEQKKGIFLHLIENKRQKL